MIYFYLRAGLRFLFLYYHHFRQFRKIIYLLHIIIISYLINYFILIFKVIFWTIMAAIRKQVILANLEILYKRMDHYFEDLLMDFLLRCIIYLLLEL